MEEKREEVANVPFYVFEAVNDKLQREHEYALKKMDLANMRMCIVSVAVCITLIMTALFYVFAYFKMNVRWIDYLENNVHVEEVEDGNVLCERNQGIDTSTSDG